MQTLAIFTLISLFFAILAVLPKHRSVRLGSGEVPQNFNLLFFGHFADLPRERFLREIAAAMKPDGSVYETMANDLYSIGWYLAHRKYQLSALQLSVFPRRLRASRAPSRRGDFSCT